MFERGALQGALDEIVTVPHTVTVLSPFSFAIEPTNQGEAVGFSVVAERIAFELRCRVVTGYLAVGLRAAVVAGATTNPHRLERLRHDLNTAGWRPAFELSRESFHLEARRVGVIDLAETELMEEAVAGAALLSEFVVDQLVITRPYGEMRPAVLREVAEDSGANEPWLYDPSERDRSSAIHRALENWLINVLEAEGIRPLDPAGEPLFDLAWHSRNTLFVCEVKSTVNSETKQLRLATGQLLHYIALLQKTTDEPVRGVILASAQPQDHELWDSLVGVLNISLLWPGRWEQLKPLLASRGDDER